MKKLMLIAAWFPLFAGMAQGAEPSTLLKPVSMEKAEALRRKQLTVLLKLKENKSRKTVLINYANQTGFLAVSGNPENPASLDYVMQEEILSVVILGPARAETPQPDQRRKPDNRHDPRRKMLQEIEEARDAGRLDGLIRKKSEKLNEMEAHDRDRLSRLKISREVFWLMLAYCAKAGNRDEKTVRESLKKIGETARPRDETAAQIFDDMLRWLDRTSGKGGLRPGRRGTRP